MKIRLLAFLVFLLAAAAPAQAYELYFGDVHSHTAYSDGQGTPEQAFDHARFTAGLDFWTVSDHLEQFATVEDPASPYAGRKEWDALKEIAQQKTEPGKFVALAGFEWGSDVAQGHMNVLRTKQMPHYAQVFSYDKFLKWAYKTPDALIGFNHPSTNGPECTIFTNMKYIPQVASQTVFIATNAESDIPVYYLALDNGWRVAPMGHQDNHNPDWGLRPQITGVYATELTPDALMEAFESRRFYAATDRAIRLWFDADGQPMGSALESAKPVQLTLAVTHTGGAAIERAQLISNGGKPVQEWTPGSPSFKQTVSVNPPPAGQTVWYALRVTTAGGRFAVSGPVWISGK